MHSKTEIIAKALWHRLEKIDCARVALFWVIKPQYVGGIFPPVLQEYVAENGELPPDRAEYNGYKVDHWLINQKSIYAKVWMPYRHKEKLESLGLQFVDTLEQRWQSIFALVQEYVEKTNTIPDKTTEYNGVKSASSL